MCGTFKSFSHLKNTIVGQLSQLVIDSCVRVEILRPSFEWYYCDTIKELLFNSSLCVEPLSHSLT